MKSWNDIILTVPKLQELIDLNELNQQIKTLEIEGDILVHLDKNNLVFVQNILLKTNTELSNLKTTSERAFENMTEINENWLKLNDIKNKMKSTKKECNIIWNLLNRQMI